MDITTAATAANRKAIANLLDSNFAAGEVQIDFAEQPFNCRHCSDQVEPGQTEVNLYSNGVHLGIYCSQVCVIALYVSQEAGSDAVDQALNAIRDFTTKLENRWA